MKTKIITTGGNAFTELNRIENREEKLSEINSIMLTPGGSVLRTVIIKGNSSGTHSVSTAMVFLPLVPAVETAPEMEAEPEPELRNPAPETDTKPKKKKAE